MSEGLNTRSKTNRYSSPSYIHTYALIVRILNYPWQVAKYLYYSFTLTIFIVQEIDITILYKYYNQNKECTG